MKALEILKKRKTTLLLIKASLVLTKKELIEIDEEIKDHDEAIAELEALQQPKSCEGCKKQDLPSIEQLMACGHCKQLAHDNFEAKEQ